MEQVDSDDYDLEIPSDSIRSLTGKLSFSASDAVKKLQTKMEPFYTIERIFDPSPLLCQVDSSHFRSFSANNFNIIFRSGQAAKWEVFINRQMFLQGIHFCQ